MLILRIIDKELKWYSRNAEVKYFINWNLKAKGNVCFCQPVQLRAREQSCTPWETAEKDHGRKDRSLRTAQTDQIESNLSRV